jgi:hypothetical protein
MRQFTEQKDPSYHTGGVEMVESNEDIHLDSTILTENP